MRDRNKFEEFRDKSLQEQAALSSQLEEEELKEKQLKHRIQRAENHAEYQRKRKDKQRTHRLITKGAAIEAICKDTKYLTEAEFYSLMDEVLNVQELQFHERVAVMVSGRKESTEED